MSSACQLCLRSAFFYLHANCQTIYTLSYHYALCPLSVPAPFLLANYLLSTFLLAVDYLYAVCLSALCLQQFLLSVSFPSSLYICYLLSLSAYTLPTVCLYDVVYHLSICYLFLSAFNLLAAIRCICVSTVCLPVLCMTAVCILSVCCL